MESLIVARAEAIKDISFGSKVWPMCLMVLRRCQILKVSMQTAFRTPCLVRGEPSGTGDGLVAMWVNRLVFSRSLNCFGRSQLKCCVSNDASRLLFSQIAVHEERRREIVNSVERPSPRASLAS